MKDSRLVSAWRMLYVTFGLLAIVAGLDKFLNLVTNWSMYVSPLALSTLPLSATTLMYIVGIVEILVGVLIFTKPRAGGIVVGIWLLLIAVNLASFGLYTGPTYYDIAVRDIALAIGAFTLATLSLHRQENPSQYHDQ